ncbi:hypothetical protein PPL_01401 [Heterostelium album PN500]|uniref:Uncharacterized protein n=1 Tax=Heterostelium pallidum (strain ATCC 26659 / Pp 5 / PN500) TaxID=670386 RepID=D3AZ61_HETP5|nr:hypothetical protein PPL_01401 [Heterostelium album PN500]EFA85444.1 hypothetical protein PPL_01401 [Heterostelium album PN500]|eukprot:XP_020437553.1 hypothetical protein PPL_01401 [Heterostelium album PN500]
MRLVKVDNKNTTTNVVVPKKTSPLKKNTSGSNSGRKSAGKDSNNQMVYFKDLESMSTANSQTNKGKEVKSLTSYYENLNKSVSSKPNVLSSSQSSNSLALLKKRASNSNNTTTTTKPASPAKQQQQSPKQSPKQQVVVNEVVPMEINQPISFNSADSTPIQSLSPKVNKSTSIVIAAAVDTPVEVAAVNVIKTPPVAPSPSKVPKEVETIRETVEVYRTKIVELEKRLEREILSSKSLKQELMLMNDVHKKEVQQLHREIDEREEHVEELYEKLETKEYSLMDIDQYKEEINGKNNVIERLEEEIHQAEEYCYEIRKEQEKERRLIEDYKKELLDCQTLVAYYQDELGLKSNELNELQRRFAGQSDELKQYKHKIQSFLQLLDTQERLKEQLVSSQQQHQQQSSIKSPVSTSSSSQMQTPKKENSSSYFNSSNQTPVSAKKKTSSITTAVNTSINNNNNSVFKSPNPLTKQRTPKKVLCSPRSVMEYI